jgi:uncharacterized protein YbcI
VAWDDVRVSVRDRAPRSRDLRQAISDAIVRVSADFIGRGPTRAKTYINGDVVLCVMEDTLTRGERSLVADGEGEAVRQMRRRFQDAMRRQVCPAVEALTERKVMSFLSDNDIEAETAIEVFILDGPLEFVPDDSRAD